jgi:hypothetical protein
MSVPRESELANRFDFYAPQYSRFESEAAAEIRREVMAKTSDNKAGGAWMSRRLSPT